MTALACIRIVVGEAPLHLDSDALAAMVSKVAGGYLELSWTWPRRFGQIAPFAFALVDPRANRHDATELQRLSTEIHRMLFGRDSDGEVTLLMLEGEQAEVMRFAGAGHAMLEALLEGRDDGTFKGRICKITPSGVTSVNPPGGPIDGAFLTETMADGTAEDAQSMWGGPAPAPSLWKGIYVPARDYFFGSVRERPMWTETGAPPPTEAELMVHDLSCLRQAGEAMKETAIGMVFVPLNYNGLIKPSIREAYAAAMAALDQEWRTRIAASVYETPRAPVLRALRQVQTLLEPYFSVINLQVTDPAFDIVSLPARMVTSVALLLGALGERDRLAAINRFASAAPTYKLKGVAQGVLGLRSPREVELCLRLKVRFIAGPAVSSAAPRPWGDITWPPDQLPYR